MPTIAARTALQSLVACLVDAWNRADGDRYARDRPQRGQRTDSHRRGLARTSRQAGGRQLRQVAELRHQDEPEAARRDRPEAVCVADVVGFVGANLIRI